jgi:hypothetical protein
MKNSPRHIQDSTIYAIRRKTDRMLESAEMYREGRDPLFHLADVHAQFIAVAALLGYDVEVRS